MLNPLSCQSATCNRRNKNYFVSIAQRGRRRRKLTVDRRSNAVRGKSKAVAGTQFFVNRLRRPRSGFQLLMIEATLFAQDRKISDGKTYHLRTQAESNAPRLL